MRRTRWPSVARQLLAEVPDAELLDRYTLRQEEDAFAQILSRYSRLVWSVCRNLLVDDADADDAFQATFLTLARSAKCLRTGDRLGPWLHGVAYRICKHARRASGRRVRHERVTARSEATWPVADSSWETAFAIATEEVQKLPEAERMAFVLCYLEGRSAGEAATSLGVRLGTFATRLTRAKQKLLARLSQRGLSAGILAVGGVSGTVAVAPAALVDRTLALIPSGVTIPSSIQGLMQGVTAMTMIRFKVLAAGVLIATGLGLSVGGGWYGSATAQVSAGPPAIGSGDPKIEELKAQLEKAKADLDRAERERRVAEELAAVLSRTAQQKFEYEPLPKDGLTTKEFEAKIAEREKAGWNFVGQVTMKQEKGSAPTLVFREKAKVALWQGEMKLNRSGSAEELMVLPGSPAPPLETKLPVLAPGADVPAKPPLIVLPGSPAPPLETKPPVLAPRANVPAKPPMPAQVNWDPIAPVPGPRPGYTVGDWNEPSRAEEARRKKVEAEYLAKIAALEKEVEALKAAKGGIPKPPDAMGERLFDRSSYGAWDPEILAEVLKKVLADEPMGHARFVIDVTADQELRVRGSAIDIATAAVWVKKLKK